MQTRYRTVVTGFILPGRPDYAAKNRGVPFERPGLFLGFLDLLFGVGHFSEPVVRRRAGLAVKNDQPDAPHQRNQTDQNPVPLLVDILQPPYGDSQGRNQQRQTVQTAQDRVQSDDTADNPDDHGGDHIVQNEHPELPARRPALKISILQFQHIQKILFQKLVILSGNT